MNWNGFFNEYVIVSSKSQKKLQSDISFTSIFHKHINNIYNCTVFV